MSKKLNESGVTSELRGQSAFFPKPKPQPVDMQQPPPELEHNTANTAPTTTPNHASIPASTLARYQAPLIEIIRKAVKDPGKEVTFVRLTLEEKRQLADITYTYKRQGIKTSENEVGRIAISYMLEDYKENAQESLLAKVIAALRA